MRTPGGHPLEVLAAVRDELDPAVRTVLVVDQFEELFAPAVPAADLSVAWTPDGTRLLGGAADRTVRVWFTDPAEAARTICGAVGVPITPAEWARHVPDLPFTPPC
ncbi:WD40 repeat domain-containing protein [Pseudonocardia oceani]|uniref:Uncharacterized protein n=1 Tax=Pseudonocardia oceani TaxID=2792013 RepID=A0ABS6U6G7_9PSEU|nr:WD40 repeat domain-containing protein [Pseudonocardia oceani]MBW0112294.1 hypothetical protein [Pseudonocardia oceani]MBW0126060.1 hypothetical protein [Pseudonocardia oceani]MBW0127807.1 hypothetical protein [Pseudonocardia oceani]